MPMRLMHLLVLGVSRPGDSLSTTTLWGPNKS